MEIICHCHICRLLSVSTLILLLVFPIFNMNSRDEKSKGTTHLEQTESRLQSPFPFHLLRPCMYFLVVVTTNSSSGTHYAFMGLIMTLSHLALRFFLSNPIQQDSRSPHQKKIKNKNQMKTREANITMYKKCSTSTLLSKSPASVNTTNQCQQTAYQLLWAFDDLSAIAH